MIPDIKTLMRALLLLTFLTGNTACDMLFPKEKRELNPKKVESVVRCNKYGTCLVIFDDGSQGLMTRPEVGIYGCKSLTERSFNECDAPSNDSDNENNAGRNRGSNKLEEYKDFPEYPTSGPR